MIEAIQFPNIGFLKIDLSQEQIKPIFEEVNEIEKNFNLSIKSNHRLVGNIKKEFMLSKSLGQLNYLMNIHLALFEQHFNFLRSYEVLSEDKPMIVNNAWVNFQEKYEFNPVHDHSGILSFVIWMKIPYDIKNEIEQSPGNMSKSPVPGHFCFYYTNSLGKMCHYGIPADKSFENSMLIFPATMNHAVYPFYSSDEYRISVSGNVVFKV